MYIFQLFLLSLLGVYFKSSYVKLALAFSLAHRI